MSDSRNESVIDANTRESWAVKHVHDTDEQQQTNARIYKMVGGNECGNPEQIQDNECFQGPGVVDKQCQERVVLETS